MQSLDDEGAAAPPAPAAPPAAPRRAARKGAPPKRGDTLGALAEEKPAAAPKKLKEKAKEKPAKAKQAKPAGKAPSKERAEPLNFRVTAEFRRAFKRAAAAQDCKKVELLERIFAEWSARNPG
jgi:hypothetical protein